MAQSKASNQELGLFKRDHLSSFILLFSALNLLLPASFFAITGIHLEGLSNRPGFSPDTKFAATISRYKLLKSLK